MAINPNILLQGIVPDIAGSVAKGLSIGREIREAPMRNRLLELQQQDAQLKQGLAQAGVISNAVGDLSIEELANPEVYSSRIDALKRAGVPVKPENDPMSDAFTGFDSAAGRLFQTSQLANRAQIQAGVGRRRVQSSKDMGGGVWQMIFNDGSSEVRVPTAEEQEQIRQGQQRDIEFRRQKKEAEAGATVTGKETAEQRIAREKRERLAAEKKAVEQAIAEVKLDTAADVAASVEKARIEAKARGEDLNLLSDMEASLPSMREFVGNLKELNKVATSTMAGRAFDAVAREFFGKSTEGDTAREKYKAIVSNEVLPLLRQTFGAAFTAAEGERLLATLGDLNRPPEQREAALDAFIESKERQIRTEQRKEAKRSGVETSGNGEVFTTSSGIKIKVK